MIPAVAESRGRGTDGVRHYIPRSRSALAICLVVWTVWSCARLQIMETTVDPAAEAAFQRLTGTNTGLTGFKMVGRLTLAEPGGPVQVYRAAVAGRLPERLRIDLFAPFGGAAASVSSDGQHLFLVRHASREYYKRRIGNGSLRRFIDIDIDVNDLLEMLVGRIPLESGCRPALASTEGASCPALLLMDRRGKLRQRIDYDPSGRPATVQWHDGRDGPYLTFISSGRQVIDGFTLPRRIVLTADSARRVAFDLERYRVDGELKDDLFVLEPIAP